MQNFDKSPKQIEQIEMLADIAKKLLVVKGEFFCDEDGALTSCSVEHGGHSVEIFYNHTTKQFSIDLDGSSVLKFNDAAEPQFNIVNGRALRNISAVLAKVQPDQAECLPKPNTYLHNYTGTYLTEESVFLGPEDGEGSFVVVDRPKSIILSIYDAPSINDSFLINLKKRLLSKGWSTSEIENEMNGLKKELNRTFQNPEVADSNITDRVAFLAVDEKNQRIVAGVECHNIAQVVFNNYHASQLKDLKIYAMSNDDSHLESLLEGEFFLSSDIAPIWRGHSAERINLTMTYVADTGSVFIEYYDKATEAVQRERLSSRNN